MAPTPKTEEEKQKAIQEFRNKASKYTTDSFKTSDAFITKWLEFKHWHVERAEKAFRKSLEWRMKNDVDSVLNENFDDIRKNFIYYDDGRDKDGRIVVTIPMNECYLRKEVDADKQRIKRFMYFIVEMALERIKTEFLTNDSQVTTFSLIMDAEGIDVQDIPPKVITMCLEVARMVEDNYPGMLEVGYIINASKAAKRMFNFNKKLLRNQAIELIHVYSAKPEKWQPKVLRNIEPEQLRARFGGSRPDEIIEREEGEATFEDSIKKLKELGNDKELQKELKKELKNAKKELKLEKS